MSPWSRGCCAAPRELPAVPADLHRLGDIEFAYIRAGRDRAADTLFVALSARGAASFGPSGVRVERTPANRLSPALEAFRTELAGTRDRKDWLGTFAASAPFRAMLRDLSARGIILDAMRKRLLILATGLPGVILLLFGIAKIAVGMSRGKPVGILAFLCIFVFASLVAALRNERFVTAEALSALDDLRERRDRALRAPLPEELPFAFAMLGSAALADTVLAPFGGWMGTTGSSSGGGCGGDGGGCGGGCGGCGGG